MANAIEITKDFPAARERAFLLELLARWKSYWPTAGIFGQGVVFKSFIQWVGAVRNV
jgi:hypothetical protein